MPWSESYLQWVATDLIHDAVREALITHRLKALYTELMKISITEPVFFQGHQRQPGEVMDVQVGPYRTQVVPGGLKRIPQFVEMAEEITQVPQAVGGPAPTALNVSPAVKPLPPAAGSFAEATAAVLKPPAAAVITSATKSLAARIRALTARRAKAHDQLSTILDAGEVAQTEVETDGPNILQQTVNAAQDDIAAITDLAAALKEMGNGPLSGS